MARDTAQRIWDADVRRRSTLPEILAEHARDRPDSPAFTFLPDGENVGQTVTFGELDRQARAIASHLAPFSGQQAVLVYPSNAEFVGALFGCLLAGVVAVHAPLIASTPERTLSRVEVVAGRSNGSLVLAPSDVVSAKSIFVADDSPLRDLPWYASDLLSADESLLGSVSPPPPDPSRLALIQYTSGTTGDARGIPLRHSHLTEQSGRIHAGTESSADSVTVGWTPLFHDMGLFASVVEPVYSGHHSVVIFPLAFLARPASWLEVMTRFGGTISGGPTFAFELAARRTTDEDRGGYDLSPWEIAFVGAEQVRPATLSRFAATFGGCGFDARAFVPVYGLAESTCTASGRTRGDGAEIRGFDRVELAGGRAVEAPGGHQLVSVGYPILDQRAEIVDPQTHRRSADGAIGELWLRSSGVADGYWNEPDATAETFGGRLADGDHGPFLRTGDLAFMLGDELFIVGRLKELVIVRGRNIYPGDIETTAQASHPSLRPGCGAAFAVDADDGEALVIAQEMRAGAADDPAIVKEAITRAVFDDHDVEVRAIVLLPPGSIPKTTSGKIQRKLCRTHFLEGAWPIPARR
jgi:acyl-CoA synthetase (AMP-forming)/AMP-acid ligase II